MRPHLQNERCSSEEDTSQRLLQEHNDEVARELLRMPFHRRNAIVEEVHGVSCMAPDESPALIDSASYALRCELDAIEDKPAFNRAQEMYRAIGGDTVDQYGYGYINTDEFRLRFLRCELFDAKKAAARMVKYLDLICDAYGPYALMRPFRLSDLSREEMSFLRGGDYQLLPFRDRSGRRILCIVTNNLDNISAKTRLKILLYLWTVAAEDVESQRKGMVTISFSGPKITVEENEKKQKFHLSRITTHVLVACAVPMRVAAIHFCFPDSPIIQILTKMYSLQMGSYKGRFKFHFGQSIELRYQLRSFGIPSELIPSTDTGNVKNVQLKQWIKLREFLDKNPTFSRRGSISSVSSDDAMYYESTGNNILQCYIPQQHNHFDQRQYQYQNQYQLQKQQDVIVECPGSNDVVFRRGKSMAYHPGNAMFHSLIESRVEKHTYANKAGKVSIVVSMIDYIRQEKGGKFLTWDAKNNWWLDMMTSPLAGTVSLQELEIQSKVNYAFRDFKKKLKTQEALQLSKSSTYAFQSQDGVNMKRLKANKSSLLQCEGCFCSDSDNTNSSS